MSEGEAILSWESPALVGILVWIVSSLTRNIFALIRLCPVSLYCSTTRTHMYAHAHTPVQVQACRRRLVSWDAWQHPNLSHLPQKLHGAVHQPGLWEGTRLCANTETCGAPYGHQHWGCKDAPMPRRPHWYHPAYHKKQPWWPCPNGEYHNIASIQHYSMYSNYAFWILFFLLWIRVGCIIRVPTVLCNSNVAACSGFLFLISDGYFIEEKNFLVG